MIELKGINKTFFAKSGKVEAVKNVNLSIEKGEIFGVIGYSGAGKSTLIRMLNLLERPTDGTVTVAGNNLSSLNEKKLRLARQDIGMIFQHFNILWSRTVRDNIAFPLEISGVSKEKRKKRVDELIQLVGLEGREDAYPSQLSGGQKQRVGIARALANNPKVLLCDEATSALDPKTTDSILELLTEINKKLGLTIVLITHEMHVIRKICHRVAVMENGNVVEEGSVLEVFHHPKEPITKDFVNQLSEPEEMKESIAHLAASKDGQLVQFTFIKGKTGSPLVTELIRRYDIEVNIIQGKISHTQDGPYGKLSVFMKGKQPVLDEALAYVRGQGVEAEVILND
ncbi:methionine ABC transporter ATP-binding protein [Pseudalkalibacillus hwajinpoensis]|uniref:Methionine ABC transporter ATP-binding protein n=1 Tax=Guptibacillus hwajinpoensis TaxID=208199 RepID=A0A4U1MF34_9BACL|nr:methionine ABC transporter ATP-binding protein [Pseudalkalibacillus hwajinpoensis]TKD69321.1 methionine ABC transporter ATP-binding protein [Pseudalkalibacillus hwajinpoensis]